MRHIEFIVNLGHFLPFYPPSPNDPKNQNFEKKKRKKKKKKHKNVWRYYPFIHIYVYHKWRSYMVPEIQDATFWAIFCTFSPLMHMIDVIIFHFGLFFVFTPLTAWKKKISEKWKKHLEMSSFYISAPKITIVWYTVVPEIWCMMDVNVIFHFGLLFALLPP